MSAHRGAEARAEYLGGCHGASRAARDPTQAAHVPRSPTRVYPTPVGSGGLFCSAGMPRPKPIRRIASPLSCSPARAPASALPAPGLDSPAQAPGKVWWRGGRGGQAARCSAAAATGTPKERTREAGRWGRSRAGGGLPGREAETQAPSACSTRASLLALLGPPHAGRGRQEGASGADTFSHSPPQGRSCSRRAPQPRALQGGAAPWVWREAKGG